MRINLVKNSSTPESVASVPTTSSTGTPFIHDREAELLGETVPRVARRTKQNIGGMRFLWNLMFVAIGLMGFLWRRDFDTWNALIARGVPTQATVYNKHITTGKSTSYYLDYQFITDNSTVSDSMNVDQFTYNQTRYGDTVPVTYLPEVRVTKWQLGEASIQRRNEQTRKWLWGSVGVAAAIGIVIAIANGEAKKHLRYLQEGKAAIAHVTRGEVIRGKHTTYRLHYVYEVDEDTRTGQTDVDSSTYQRMTEGNPFFTVLYDASRPEHSIPYFQITQAYLVASGRNA